MIGARCVDQRQPGSQRAMATVVSSSVTIRPLPNGN